VREHRGVLADMYSYYASNRRNRSRRPSGRAEKRGPLSEPCVVVWKVLEMKHSWGLLWV